MTTKNALECPYKWQTGWDANIKIGCCGQETPFRLRHKWYIYVWDTELKEHKYYCFNDDLYYSDLHYEKYIREA